MKIVKIYLRLSLELLQTVWSQSFSDNSLVQLVLLKVYSPLPMLVLLKVYSPLPMQLNLLHLSLPKRSPLFILASSVWWSLQCLISALTQGGGGGHLFRLTCSVVLWGGGEEHCEQMSLVCVGSARSVSAMLGLPPLTACVLSRSTLLRL